MNKVQLRWPEIKNVGGTRWRERREQREHDSPKVKSPATIAKSKDFDMI